MFKNTTGYKGVSFNKKRNEWRAFACVNGTQKYLGKFPSAEAASLAYEKYFIDNNLEHRISSEKMIEYRKKRKRQERIRSYNKNKDKMRERQQTPEWKAYKAKYDFEHKNERSLYGKNRTIKLKLAAIEAYGKICNCCKEYRWQLLTIDHSFNDGAKQRRELGCGKGNNFYSWLKKNNYPKNLGLKVLCWNCNSSRGAFGYCPHEKEVYIMQDWE